MKIGSLVELVKEFERDYGYYWCTSRGGTFPTMNTVYTIRGIATDNVTSATGITLEEIVNPKMKFTLRIVEPHFCIEYFREIQPPLSVSIESIISETVEA